MLGDHEKIVRLHAENFLWGNITFDYGQEEDERQVLAGGSAELSKSFRTWLIAEDRKDTSEEHKNDTVVLSYQITAWRVRGRIKGILIDQDLETKIKKLEAEKADLESKLMKCEEDTKKAVKALKDQDRTIAYMEAQIFELKKGR